MLIFNPHKAIEALNQFLPDNPIIVEVGAFNGSDTRRMVAQWPKSSVYSFEPLPEIYQQLEHNMQHLSQVHCYQLALSNRVGTALFYVSERPTHPGIASQAGSLRKPKERLSRSSLLFPRTAMVQTTTLDVWAHENVITSIDLLWLDTQGHELAILEAAPIMIKNVKVIISEVSFIESYAGQPLYEEVVAWMDCHGFEHVGRDFENTDKTFFGNALFVKK